MGFIGDFFGGGSQTVTQQVNLTPEQRELIGRQVELADFQLAELKRQRRFQRQAFTGAESAAEALDTPDAVQQELLDDQLDRIRAGGQATPEEIDLINQAVEQALAAGETDIERFRSEGLESLREELAPQLGLRPGDTPILDRGGRIVAESQRQQGQLVSGLRGQQALSRLNFPLQRASTVGSLNQNLQQFQSQLRQNAFTNRLQLAGARSTAGLGLAGVATPNIGPAFANTGFTQTTDSTPGFGQIAGGLGGLALGLGSLGLLGGGAAGASTGATIAAGVTTLGSSREIKDIDGMVNEAQILEALKKLPVGVWNYKGENTKHIGPFAEDFREAFGVSDGKTISIIDAIGVLMAAVKALAKREVVHGAA